MRLLLLSVLAGIVAGILVGLQVLLVGLGVHIPWNVIQEEGTSESRSLPLHRSHAA